MVLAETKKAGHNILENFSLTMPSLWIILFVIFVISEAMTVGLVSIWFCAGAICAFITAKSGAAVYVQFVVFVVVSVALLVLTRPFVNKVLKIKAEPTNLDRIIGQKVPVTENIDNLAETGAIKYDGKIWTARSLSSDIVFNKGEFVTVEKIEGVKVIVK